MPRLYFYKLTSDSGGAPCVQGGLLSLAICKPAIREHAQVGDLIFGFAANSLHRDNRLIYIAEITEKICDGNYYVEKRFAEREDRIYRRQTKTYVLRKTARHHDGPGDLEHDLGKPPAYSRAKVLLSTNFRYFGKDCTVEYKNLFPKVGQAVEKLGIGERVHHSEKLREELLRLQEKVWQETRVMMAGSPTSGPRRGVSHRSRSCGVVGVRDRPRGKTVC